MIVLDTHVWVWWVHGDERLTETQAEVIETNETNVIGVSAISCWEIAKLVGICLPGIVSPWQLERHRSFKVRTVGPRCERVALVYLVVASLRPTPRLVAVDCGEGE